MTSKQKSLVIGKLLGDGSLEDRGSANSRFQVRHTIFQKAYVDWVFEQLKDLSPSKPKQNHDSYYFRTRNLPEFTRLRKVWYKNGIKILPKNLKLDPFILSIWYMDDGYFDRVRKSFWFCTHCYDLDELELLQKLLRELKIDSSRVKDRSHYKLRVRSKDSEKFLNLVKSYILPSMKYKIGITP